MTEAMTAGDAAGKKAAERWNPIQATTTATCDAIAMDEIAALTSVPPGDHCGVSRGVRSAR
jgi:hypothetical protein